MSDLAGKKEIYTIMRGMVRLAADGVPMDDWLRHLGFDAEAVREIAAEAADEEFVTLPGLPPEVRATGRLRSLSASHRQLAKDALVDTFIVAIQVGVALERVRRNIA